MANEADEPQLYAESTLKNKYVSVRRRLRAVYDDEERITKDRHSFGAGSEVGRVNEICASTGEKVLFYPRFH